MSYRLSTCGRVATQARQLSKNLEDQNFVQSKSKIEKGKKWLKCEKVKNKKWYKHWLKLQKDPNQYDLCQSGQDCVNKANSNAENDLNENRMENARNIATIRETRKQAEKAKQEMFTATAAREEKTAEREQTQQLLYQTMIKKYERDQEKDMMATTSLLLTAALEGQQQVEAMVDELAKVEKEKYIKWLIDHSNAESGSVEYKTGEKLCITVKNCLKDGESVWQKFYLLLKMQKDKYGL